MQPLVLVIDDSLVVRAILDTCLRRAGYQVRCFEDGSMPPRRASPTSSL